MNTTNKSRALCACGTHTAAACALAGQCGRGAGAALAVPVDQRAKFEHWMAHEAKIVVGSTDPYPAGLERDYWRVWQAASVSSEPEGWRAFIENCSRVAGSMVNGNRLAIAAKELLGQARANGQRMSRVASAMEALDGIGYTYDEEIGWLPPKPDADMRAELARLRADVQEWACDACNHVYPGPPQPGFKAVMCPRCSGTTAPRATVERMRVEAQLDETRKAIQCLSAELQAIRAGETVRVEYNLSPAQHEGAIRSKLIELGWTPPEQSA